MLNHWQQLAWQDNYRQLLEQDRLTSSRSTAACNPGWRQQQQALLAVLDRQPVSVLRREAQRLAALNLFLPDNQLLLHFIRQTGETALYLKLWRQPVDHDSLTAAHHFPAFIQGGEARRSADRRQPEQRLMVPALHQLSRLSPCRTGPSSSSWPNSASTSMAGWWPACCCRWTSPGSWVNWQTG